MLSGATFSASAMAGTAVFRIVVSSDSMKNATATSHGKSRLEEILGSITCNYAPSRSRFRKRYERAQAAVTQEQPRPDQDAKKDRE